MRILFLAFRDPSNPYVGGGDIYINELAKGCLKRGHQVAIVSSRFPGSRKEELIEGVKVIRVGNGFTMFAKVFTHYFRYLRGKFDIVVEEIMGGPRIPFFARLYVKEKLIGILQQSHKEIFRHQFPFPVFCLLSLLERFLVLLYRDKVIIVNSYKTKQDLCEIGFKKHNLLVVYPGLHDWFLTKADSKFQERHPRVICLAKFRRYKLIHHAVLAIKNVCKELPHFELILAGRTTDVDPTYMKKLEKLIKDLGLSNNVHFRRDISESEKIKLLSSSIALVLPSAIEGFGIVVIEANALGTPAIVSDSVPGDVAINMYNALIFPCGDINCLSKAILFLASDEKKWTEMSIKSIKWARKFTWNRSIEKFISILNILVKDKAGADHSF